MRIPPYHRNPGWQRFFAGAAIGAFISWFLFFYMYGVQQEKQIQEIHRQSDVIQELQDKNAIWEEDYKKLNEKNEKILTIQGITVKINNGDTYGLDRLSVTEAEELIREDLTPLLAKDIETVYNGRVLLKNSIENNIVEINKKRYSLKVIEVIFYTELYIEVELRRL
ncbi:sporulation membrane protein YtrI [Bacillus massiliglaciei]|uniref:sporulation membrane protein YtrI n=1 Tax=Bacillus massiliglaciei TaxID=1816693 RepID=UPI000A55D490|nr:sporulation membrane protein YtrI [Bacillus massiliglaciei]